LLANFRTLSKHLSANPVHCFNFKQPKILGSIAGQKKFLLESLLIQEYQPDLDIDGSSIAGRETIYCHGPQNQF